MFITAFQASALSGKSDDDAIRLGIALTAMLSRCCNREFPLLVESAMVNGNVTTLTIYGHSMRAGDRIRINNSFGEEVDAVVLADGLSDNQIRVDISDEPFDLSREAVARPIRTGVYRTRAGEYDVSVPLLPLASVLSVSVPSGDGYEVLDADRYVVNDTNRHDVSLSGTISLIGRRFERSGRNPWNPLGVRVEYVSGEPFVLPEAVQVMTAIMPQIRRRERDGRMQSESYDYYSYSRLSSDDVGRLFGEVDHTIRLLRIAA